MAIRSNVGLVEAVLADNYNGRTPLAPFLGVASRVVDRLATAASGKGYTLTTLEKQDLETWLAAHFYQCGPDKGYTSRSTGGASGSFEGQTAMGFEATFYGQMAMNIDPSGALKNIDKQQFASADWLGKPESEQITYIGRQ